MSKVENFLTTSQEQEIIEEIRFAEKNTSGEIRVHLEKCTKKEPLERAKEVFHYLKMDETKHQNGVLFYVAVDDKKFSVIGDCGINKAVSKTFWRSVKKIVLQNFKKDLYANGLKLGIIETGKKLKKYFPYKKHDKNELPNSVSLG